MAQHIVLMNLVAPLLALLAPRLMPLNLDRSLAAATIVQLTLIWGWHAPPALDAAMHSPLLHIAMQVSLFVAALWFWSAVFAVAGARRWRPILALLVTGKLFCLLGVLLTFAPRHLYAADICGPGFCPPALLADQQMAGLLMLVACPATYLVAAVLITVRWIDVMQDAAPAPQTNIVRS